ncbi:MAG: DUF4111 domain-containing protein [Thermomicrobiales bacterium]
MEGVTPPTGEPEADALLPLLRDGIAAALEPEPRLLGLYLYGSLATGDFTPGASDIDPLAVAGGPITPAVIDRLRPMHAAIVAQQPHWDDRVEVVYAPRQGLAAFRAQVMDIGVISPGEPLHIVAAGVDWLMNWHQARYAGAVLWGPPAATLVPETTVAEYVAAVRDHAAAFGEWMPAMTSARQQSYAVLTLTRALYTVRHGRGASKAAAAAWLARESPGHAPLLDQALRWREHPPADPTAAPRALRETRRFVAAMQAEVAASG